MHAYVLCAKINVYCVFSSKHLCVCTFKNFVFLFACVCIYKNLLRTCTYFTVFIDYTTTYLYALLIQLTSSSCDVQCTYINLF